MFQGGARPISKLGASTHASPLRTLHTHARTHTQQVLANKTKQKAGDETLVRELKAKGFDRVQLNATAANNFDSTSVTPETAARLHAIAKAFPEVQGFGRV